MKLQMTVCPHVRHRPHAQRKFGLEFVTLAKSNDRFCEIMQRRRGRLTNLVGVRSEELLRVHRADLSCVDGVCFAREKCFDCAVSQYSPVSGL